MINQDDFISFRHHVYSKEKGEARTHASTRLARVVLHQQSVPPRQVGLMEAGPRFELKLYQLKLGTIEQTEVENEWVLRPYMNTARKSGEHMARETVEDWNVEKVRKALMNLQRAETEASRRYLAGSRSREPQSHDYAMEIQSPGQGKLFFRVEWKPDHS